MGKDDDEEERGQIVRVFTQQAFIVFSLRYQAQANAGPSEVKDTDRAPWETQLSLQVVEMREPDSVKDDNRPWGGTMSALFRVVWKMRVSKWVKAVFQKK